jgi:hypothetical protein
METLTMLADEVKKSDVGGRNMSISKGGEGTDDVAEREDATVVPHEVIVHLLNGGHFFIVFLLFIGSLFLG